MTKPSSGVRSMSVLLHTYAFLRGIGIEPLSLLRYPRPIPSHCASVHAEIHTGTHLCILRRQEGNRLPIVLRARHLPHRCAFAERLTHLHKLGIASASAPPLGAFHAFPRIGRRWREAVDAN